MNLQNKLFHQTSDLKQSLIDNNIENMKIVLLLWGEIHSKEIKELHSFIKKKNENVKIICFNDITKYQFENESLQCYGPDDYCNEDAKQFAESERSAYRLSEIWFKKKGGAEEDLMVYRGISLGNAIDIGVKVDLFFILNLMQCIKTMILTEKPEVLLLIGKETFYYNTVEGLVRRLLSRESLFYLLLLGQKDYSKLSSIQNFFKNFKMSNIGFSVGEKQILFKLPYILIASLKNLYSLGIIVLTLIGKVRQHDRKAKNKKKILLADPGAYAYIGKPIFQLLSKINNIELNLVNSFASLPPKGSHFFKRIIAFRILSQWRAKKKQKKMKRCFLEIWNNEIGQNIELWTIDGVFIGDIVGNYFRKNWLHHMLDLIPEIEKHMRLFEKHRFDMILTHTAKPPLIRTLVLVAKQKEIPVIEYQHGTAFCVQIFFPAISDYFWVWSRKNANYFIKNGVPSDRIKLIGNIMGDQLVKYKIKEKKKANNYVIIVSPHSPTFSFPRKYNSILLYNIQCIKGVIKMAERFPKVKFIIKTRMRPCANKMIPIYQDLISNSGFGNIEILDHNYGFWELLAGCDALVNRSSGMGIEAALLGIPMIQTTFGMSKNLAKALVENGCIQDIDLMNFAASGSAIRAETIEDMPVALEKIYNDPRTKKDLEQGRKKLLEQYCFNHDNKASERAVAHLKEILNIA